MHFPFLSNFKKHLGWIVGLILFAPWAQGCPCGCGSASPMGMYPGETFKYQLAAQHLQNKGLIRSDRSWGEDPGPLHTSVMSLSLAYSITTKWSVSLLMPLTENRYFDDTHTGWEDPNLGVRWMVRPYEFADPALPQITLMLGYKPLWPGHNTPAPSSLADHSNGFQEVTSGVEWIWDHVGMQNSMTYKWPKQVHITPERSLDIAPAPTWVHQWFAVISHPPFGQVQGGLEYETKGGDYMTYSDVAGKPAVFVPDSQSFHSQLFGAVSLRVGDRKTAGLKVTTLAPMFVHKNAPSRTSVTLSFQQTI